MANSRLQRPHTYDSHTYQMLIRSPDGADPANFTATLINHIKLDQDKNYVIGLHNGILSASWNTAPLGVAFTHNTVDITIPQGHYTFEELVSFCEPYFGLEAVQPQGKTKITVSAGDTVILKSIAVLLGFTDGDTFTAGEYTSTGIANLSPVNYLSVHTNIIDINATRSNVNSIRPNIRTALVPPCLKPYEYFDICSNSDDYYVKSTKNEISSIDIRVSDQDGRALQLDRSIPSYWTITIKELDLI